MCRFLSKQARRANSNSFSTSGTSQQRLHVTCLRTYLCTAVSRPYEGRAMDPRYKYYHSHSHQHVLHCLLCCYHIHSLTEYEQLRIDCCKQHNAMLSIRTTITENYNKKAIRQTDRHKQTNRQTQTDKQTDSIEYFRLIRTYLFLA